MRRENIVTKKIVICGDTIEIKDFITLSELAEARKTTYPAARAMMQKHLRYEKIGMYIMISPQKVTFPKRGRKLTKLVGFYEINQDKDLIISEECVISDVAKILNICYLSARKLLKRNNIILQKDESNIIKVPPCKLILSQRAKNNL